MKLIDFKELKEGSLVIVDLETCPMHMRGDYETRNENVLANRKLCTKCDGTGNQLYSMYQRCSICNGDGYLKTKE